jgi:hypothetical protein
MATTDMATTDMAGTDMADTMVAPAIAITGQEMAIEAVAARPETVIEEAMPEGIEAAAVDLMEEIREASEAIVAESRAAGAAGFTAAVEVVSMEEAVDSTAEAVVTVADATEKYSIGGRSKRSGRFFIFASSEKSLGHRYAPMAAGSSACATLLPGSRACESVT